MSWLLAIKEVSDLWNWVCLSLSGGCHDKITVYLGAGLLWPLKLNYTRRKWLYSSPTSIFHTALSDFLSLPISGRSIQLSQCFSSWGREGSLPGIKSLVRLKASMSHWVQSCSQPQLSLLLPTSSGRGWGNLIGGSRTRLPCLAPLWSTCPVCVVGPPKLELLWEVPLWRSGSPTEISANRSRNSVEDLFQSSVHFCSDGTPAASWQRDPSPP